MGLVIELTVAMVLIGALLAYLLGWFRGQKERHSAEKEFWRDRD